MLYGDIIKTVKDAHGDKAAEKLETMVRLGSGLLEMLQFDLGEDANHMVDTFYGSGMNSHDWDDLKAWEKKRKLERRF